MHVLHDVYLRQSRRSHGHRRSCGSSSQQVADTEPRAPIQPGRECGGVDHEALRPQVSDASGDCHGIAHEQRQDQVLRDSPRRRRRVAPNRCTPVLRVP